MNSAMKNLANPNMQTMLRMVGFGDNAGSGFPTILATWQNEGWVEPKLVEEVGLNQVTLVLCMAPSELLENKVTKESAENRQIYLKPSSPKGITKY